MKYLGKEVYHPEAERMHRISLFMFFAYFSFAMIASIWSLYIDSLVSSEALVGFTVAFFSLLSFVSFFLIIPLVEKYDKVRLIFISFLITGFSYFLFFLNKTFWIFFLIASCMMVLKTVRISSAGILVEKNSTRRSLSRNEGFIFSILNIAFFLGPMLSYFIVSVYGFQYVFLFSSALVFIALFILHRSSINHGGTKKRIDVNPLKNFVDFFRKRDRVIAYCMSLGIQFWWSLCFTFIPLYLIKNMPSYSIGIFLGFLGVPLFTTEFYFARLAGKYGYRRFFFTGYMIASLAALVSFLFFSPGVVIVALLLASFGLAMLEPTSQSYFFDILHTNQDQRFYPLFNTSMTVGLFLGQVLASLVLLYFDFRYIFLVFSFGCFVLALLSLKAKKILESRRSKASF